MSLLDRARELQKSGRVSRRHYTDEDIELLFGWLRGDIQWATFARILKEEGRSPYIVAGVVKEAFNQGKLAIKA